MNSHTYTRSRHCLFFIISICLGIILFVCLRICVRLAAERSRDGSNLREVVQASYIYAQDHNDQFPTGKDIWDHARILAEVDLDSVSFWQSRIDPATDPNHARDSILTPGQQGEIRQLTTAFHQIKPSYAIPAAELNTNMPATTPIIWTRGLQPNGSWSKHSPYGTQGGLITFIGGNTSYFMDLSNEGG